MAEEKKNEQEVTQQPTAAQPTARERYRSRYKEAHPDMNLDDDEAFYTQANENLDELENYRESNRLLGEAFDKTPLLAGLVIAAKDGENPFAYLAENIGPDMDIRELLNNPDFSKKMGEALAKYQEKMAAAAKAEEEAGRNFEDSMNALSELQKEKGFGDEERIALIKKFFGEFDENGNVINPGIIGNASVGIVPKEVWEAVLKAQNYDNDIAAATDKARAAALNEKVQNGIRDFGTEIPPTLSTGGAGKPAAKNDEVSFSKFGT